MFEPHNQLSNLPSVKHEGGTGSSTRGRKRKNAAGGAASGSSSGKMYRAQQQQQQQQQQGGFHRGGPRQNSNQFGGPRGAFGPSGGQMLPPSLMQSSRQSTGMGFGLPLERDSSDFILDDMDTLSARDLAMARYRRNDELLNLVFDARRIDTLEPPESPYAQIDQSALQERLKEGQAELDKLRDEHNQRFKRLKEEAAKQDAQLHSAVKRSKLGSVEVAPASTVTELEEYQEEETPAEWAKDPSKGRIIGLGYIRAVTPDEVRALLPKAPEPPAAPVLAPAQPAASTTESTTVKEDGTTERSAASGVTEPVPATGAAAAAVTTQPGRIGEVADSSMSVAQDDTEMTGVTMQSEDEDAEDDDEEDGDEEDDGDDDDDDEEGEGEEDDEDDEDAAGDDADADADGDADADADGDADADADADVEAEGEGETVEVLEGGEPVPEGAAEETVDVSLPDATMDESIAAEQAAVPAAVPIEEESLIAPPAGEEVVAAGEPEEQPAEPLDLEMQEAPLATEDAAEGVSALTSSAAAVEEAPLAATEPVVAENAPVAEESAPVEPVDLSAVEAEAVPAGEAVAEAAPDAAAVHSVPEGEERQG